MWLTIADRIQGLSWLGHSQDLRAEGQRNSCHAQDVLEREPHNMIKSTPQGLYPSSNRQKVSDITVQDHRWTGEIISRQETLQGNGINSYRPESNPMLYTPSPGPPSRNPTHQARYNMCMTGFRECHGMTRRTLIVDAGWAPGSGWPGGRFATPRYSKRWLSQRWILEKHFWRFEAPAELSPEDIHDVFREATCSFWSLVSNWFLIEFVRLNFANQGPRY